MASQVSSPSAATEETTTALKRMQDGGDSSRTSRAKEAAQTLSLGTRGRGGTAPVDQPVTMKTSGQAATAPSTVSCATMKASGSRLTPLPQLNLPWRCRQ